MALSAEEIMKMREEDKKIENKENIKESIISTGYVQNSLTTPITTTSANTTKAASESTNKNTESKTKEIKGSDVFGYNQKFDTDNMLTGIAKRFLAVGKSLFKGDEKKIKEIENDIKKAVETKKRTTLANNKEKIETTILWKTDKSFDEVLEIKAVETKALTASPATPANTVPNKFNMNTILIILIMVLLITIVVKSITLKQDKKQKPM